MRDDSFLYTGAMDSPRVIKSHLPISMLNPDVLKTGKIIVVLRNPKDCVASLFHHERLLPNYNIKDDFSFDEYAQKFIGTNGSPTFGDYWMWVKVS